MGVSTAAVLVDRKSGKGGMELNGTDQIRGEREKKKGGEMDYDASSGLNSATGKKS
jgi:hypothetical protein